MSEAYPLPPHDHVFLGHDHDKAERRTWAVIALCSVMMIAEIVGGMLFGSLALVADGLHMSTHAGAMLGPRYPAGCCSIRRAGWSDNQRRPGWT